MHLVKQQAGQFLMVFLRIMRRQGGESTFSRRGNSVYVPLQRVICLQFEFYPLPQAFWKRVYAVYTQPQAYGEETDGGPER